MQKVDKMKRIVQTAGRNALKEFSPEFEVPEFEPPEPLFFESSCIDVFAFV